MKLDAGELDGTNKNINTKHDISDTSGAINKPDAKLNTDRLNRAKNVDMEHNVVKLGGTKNNTDANLNTNGLGRTNKTIDMEHNVGGLVGADKIIDTEHDTSRIDNISDVNRTNNAKKGTNM